MKTVNGIMYIMNDLFFVGYFEEDDYKKIVCVRNVLVDDFQDLKSKKLMKLLGILDDLYIPFRTQEFSHIVEYVK